MKQLFHAGIVCIILAAGCTHAHATLDCDYAKAREKDPSIVPSLTLEELQRGCERSLKPDVRIGMTEDQARESKWGEPEDINTTTTADSDHAQWVYGGNRYLYFTDGRLTAIQH